MLAGTKCGKPVVNEEFECVFSIIAQKISSDKILRLKKLLLFLK